MWPTVGSAIVLGLPLPPLGRYEAILHDRNIDLPYLLKDLLAGKSID